MLFATLDPTLRRGRSCRSGMKIILSDTVGFISDLPTMLVAAFRATLEEVIEADVILHVRDVVARGHRGAGARRRGGAAASSASIPATSDRLIEVWNKIDRLDAEGRTRLQNLAERQPAGRRPVLVSAVTGRGGRDADRGDRGAARRAAASCSISCSIRRTARA